MEKLIDAILIAVFATLIAAGGRYSIHQVAVWSQKLALEKAAQGLGQLEPATRKMTGGKLDF